MLTDIDRLMLKIALDEARSSFDVGGCPIGSVLARGGLELSRGHNQRVQQGDPIAHGEMDALRKAGRQKTYRDTVLYTTLSPCMMCSGTIASLALWLVKIKLLVVMRHFCVNMALRWLLLMTLIVSH